jgi:endonuclease YncB( thermonuclease family)
LPLVGGPAASRPPARLDQGRLPVFERNTSSQAEAQDLYERAGPGDPHGLDADDDGRACDSNPCSCRGPGGGGGGGRGEEPRRRFQTIRSKIVRVIDGDTVVIRPLERTKWSQYTARLLGIDSPERRPRECGANLATENARRLAPRGRSVLLKTAQRSRCLIGLTACWRTCVYRAVGSSTGQVAAGWAKVLVVGRRFQQYGDYKRYARRAKRVGFGAWGICGGMHVPA